jgi:hypothetical protein
MFSLLFSLSIWMSCISQDFSSLMPNAKSFMWQIVDENGGYWHFSVHSLEQVLERVIKGVEGFGFCCQGWIQSPITGAEGNVEFLACFHRLPAVTQTSPLPDAIVEQWNGNLVAHRDDCRISIVSKEQGKLLLCVHFFITTSLLVLWMSGDACFTGIY